MTTEWINKPTDQKDDYMPISLPDPFTLEACIALKARTAGRFSFTLQNNGKVVDYTYINYTLGYNDTKIKINKETGSAVMLARVKGQAVVK